MALTWANQHVIYRGPRTLVYAEATFDNSYDAGGETVHGGDISGLTSIIGMTAMQSGGYDSTYTRTNDTSGKIQIFASLTPDTNSATSVPLESAAARDFSTTTISYLIVGR